jgi:hypothetical protein
MEDVGVNVWRLDCSVLRTALYDRLQFLDP